MGEAINCKEIAQLIKDEAKELLTDDGVKGYAKLTIINFDDGNEAGQAYVRGKVKDCEEVGIDCEVITKPRLCRTKELIQEIKYAQLRERCVIVQKPFPDTVWEPHVLEALDPNYDADGFVGNLVDPCTPAGIVRLFDELVIHHGYQTEGKHAVIINRSEIVGKPLANLLLGLDMTVTICHSKTKDLKEICQSADVIIVAVGKPNFLKADMVKEGAIVIDVGVNRKDGKLCGDATEEVKEKCSFYTPVPGGVGLMTRAMLIDNIVTLAIYKKEVLGW